MQTAIEKLIGLERRLTITVPATEVTQAYQEKLQKVAKTAKIDGFRPGRVPTHLIEQKFGKSVHQEVLSELMQNSFQNAVKENNLHIAGQPRIEPKSMDKNQELVYDILFETLPEINLTLLTGVDMQRETAQVSDADLAKMLHKIQQQHTQWEEVERPVQMGDRITLDFKGFLNGEAFTGGESKDFQLTLGSKTMIPGFEEGLVGAIKNQELKLPVTFPQEYPAENLAGKATEFDIKIHRIEAPKLPELNDEFAKLAGVAEGIDKLKHQVSDNMQRELNRALETRMKNRTLNKLLSLNAIDVPKALVDQEIHHLQQMTRQQMKMMGGGKHDVSKIPLERDPYVARATKRVKIGLLLAEVIKLQDIKVEPSKVRSKIDELASSYQKPEEVVKWYYSNQDLLTEVEAVVLEEQAVAYLLADAQIQEQASDYETIMAAAQKDEDE